MMGAVFGGFLVGIFVGIAVGYARGAAAGRREVRDAFLFATIATVNTHRTRCEVRAVTEVLWRSAFPGAELPLDLFPPDDGRS